MLPMPPNVAPIPQPAVYHPILRNSSRINPFPVDLTSPQRTLYPSPHQPSALGPNHYISAPPRRYTARQEASFAPKNAPPFCTHSQFFKNSTQSTKSTWNTSTKPPPIVPISANPNRQSSVAHHSSHPYHPPVPKTNLSTLSTLYSFHPFHPLHPFTRYPFLPPHPHPPLCVSTAL